MDARSSLDYTEQLRLWPHEVAGDFQPVLERYPVPGSSKRPCVLICPGGAYAHRAGHEGVDVAEAFNKLGFHAAVIQYRVKPNLYPAPQQDGFRAIKLLRANAERWGILKDQIAVCGFSAGGHLAASLGTLYREVDADAGDAADAECQKPDALILCYAVINFISGGHLGSGENLCGAKFHEMKRRLSLDTRIDEDTPPSFLWHTAADSAVPFENTLLWARRMAECGRPVELHVYPNGSHGLGLAPDYPDIRQWPDLAAAWMRSCCHFM